MRSSPRRHARALVLPLIITPALASCAFLLDFDGLQDGEPPAAGSGGAGTGGTVGAGGSGGTSGGEGGAGTGGGPDCPASCFDDDPCTLDGCGGDGECVREPIVGLTLDGVDETVAADLHYRVTLASAPDGFLFSSYSLEGATPALVLYRLDADDPEASLEPLASFDELAITDAAEPLSAAGMAFDGVGLLHAFIGIRDRTGTARVVHLGIDANGVVRSRNAAGDSYYGDLPTLHPVALTLGSTVHAAWINADRSVSLGGPSAAPLQRLADGVAASTVSLLGTSNQTPVAFYGVEGGGLFVERALLPAIAVNECQTRSGSYLSSSATSAGIAGFWLGSWTKFGEASGGLEGYLTTEGRGIACIDLTCVPDASADCPAGAQNNLVRNPALVAASLPGDPIGTVHVIQATPLIGVEPDSDEIVAGIIAGAARIDYGAVPFEGPPDSAALGDPVELARQPTSEAAGFRGPDWPVVGFAAPDRVAMAWIQPSPNSGGDELRVQRYRLCPGP